MFYKIHCGIKAKTQKQCDLKKKKQKKKNERNNIPVIQAYTAYPPERFDILPGGAIPPTEIGFDTCEWIEEEQLIYRGNNT